MRVGDHVRIQRDEAKYPPKGTWSQFAGRTGVLVVVNRGRTEVIVGRPPGMSKKLPAFPREVNIDTEYGVSFTKSNHVDAWFQHHELTVLKGA